MITNKFATIIACLALGFATFTATGTARAQDDDDEMFDDVSPDDGMDVEDDEDVGAPTETTETTEMMSDDGGVFTPPKWGIGAQRTLVGVVGPSLELAVGEKLLVEGVLGLGFISPSAEGADSVTALLFAVGAFYSIVNHGPVALMIGGRLNVGHATNVFVGAEGAEGSTEFALEGPIRLQWWATDFISFHVETGLVLDFVSDHGAVFSGNSPDSTTIAIGSHGELIGSAGFTLYLP